MTQNIDSVCAEKPRLDESTLMDGKVVITKLCVPRYHVACESGRWSRAKSTLAANSTHPLFFGIKGSG